MEMETITTVKVKANGHSYDTAMLSTCAARCLAEARNKEVCDVGAMEMFYHIAIQIHGDAVKYMQGP